MVEILLVTIMVYLIGYVASKLMNYKPEGGQLGYLVTGVTILVMCLIFIVLLKQLI